ncbi:hypothetical protein P2W68_06785 [Chryseobacterium arthrosphaerae]|uniref:hypothetical protein n=1 Tax=Chryseobacterium arthrosphaerae TaxID=651561 RepID=UPI0023E34BF3|nr:hypothetical protein [Chryseobacterium arthrosphaerae]WES99315.1 hypothetical protein P2W68_06785 [Chryseobacterium arthrosphaerae]
MIQIDTKRGIALDFIVYVIAMEDPVSYHGIHEFFLQNFDVEKPAHIPEIRDIKARLDGMQPDISIDIKNIIISETINDLLSLYPKELSPQKVESSDELITDYFEYINRYLNINAVIVNDGTVDFSNIGSIDEIYNDEEINKIVSAIKTIIIITTNIVQQLQKHKSESLPINQNEINSAVISEHFQNYLLLRIISPNIYISYYASLVFSLQKRASNFLGRFIREVNGISESILVNKYSSREKYLDYQINENEKLLFEHSFQTPQLDGSFFAYTESSIISLQSSFISLEESLKNYLNILSASELLRFADLTGVNLYQYLELNAEHSLYGIKLKYLNLQRYGDKVHSQENKFLENELDVFMKEKSVFVDYLQLKSFDNSTIKIILNALSENKYSSNGVKGIEFKNDIYFFRFCYFFYIFDYFYEVEGKKFDTIASFERITKFNMDNKREVKQQYLKNFIDIDNPQAKHYPFTFKTTDAFLKEFEYSLGINREKLKPIPE